MGWRRRPKFHGLKRYKARQTWNKYNLYNISRLQTPYASIKTYFQQKWLAKSLTRAYHGEYVREGYWERMFSTRIPTVVPMDPTYLARTDGSQESAGRGRGLEVVPEVEVEKEIPQQIPYMQMVYGPMERRLDQAIFRALFASSSRQAKQFVTHGHVKVNGKQMKYPGYLLNPGDMFQVDIDKVMIATGAPKSAAASTGAQMRLDEATDAESNAEIAAAEDETEEEEGEVEEDKADQDEADDADAEKAGITDVQKAIKSSLKSLRDRTKTILKDAAKELPAKQKRSLRAYTRTVRTAISNATSATHSTLDELDAEFHQLTSNIKHKDAATTPADHRNIEESATSKPLDDDTVNPTQTELDSTAFREAFAAAEANPVDPSKPYATPWRPRDYMSPFAFIPRYLEVNQNICSAVYLRHPVARPGSAEVPTPWGVETGQLAFNWYLRRR